MTETTYTTHGGLAVAFDAHHGLPPEAYRGTHGTPYRRPSYLGYRTVPCLDSLRGRPWDQAALNLVHALRPSSIRVTTGMLTADWVNWRVTVTVDDAGVITSIEQEAEIGLSR